MTLESATSIAANLNSLENAIAGNDHTKLVSAICTLRANLFAEYYDVLPVINGRKSWPPIKRGDTWTFAGRPVPYADDEIDPIQREYIPGDLKQCSQILRDDVAVRDDLLGNGPMADGRILVSISQEIWNNWCAAIGDLASLQPL